MTQVNAYLANSTEDPLHLATIPRRAVGSSDVSIKIVYCGICHSDISLYKNDWHITAFPLVPGHEIVGIVEAVGDDVKKFKQGDRVGVGCMVDSCRKCTGCKKGVENYCEAPSPTYGIPDRLTGQIQYGGYSEKIVVNEDFVLSIPENLDLASAAPLLCAGITTYSPLVDAKIQPGQKVGIVGVGGLGHVGIKLARAIGAEVYAFTTKEAKRESLLKLGANEVVVTTDKEQFAKVKGQLNLIIDTISDKHDLTPYIESLAVEGTYSMVGAGDMNFEIPTFAFLMKGLYFHGSGIGSIARTQEMLDLCGKHNVTSDIEIGHLDNLPELYDRIHKGDVRYRVVLDIENDFKAIAAKQQQ